MNQQGIEFNLCPLSNVKPLPVFESQEAYERFRLEFVEAVRPDLEKYKIARMRSEEAARNHWVD